MAVDLARKFEEGLEGGRKGLPSISTPLQLVHEKLEGSRSRGAGIVHGCGCGGGVDVQVLITGLDAG